MHEHWNLVRAFYKAHEHQILKSRSEWGVDPYAWEEACGISMTPIESAVWSDIRMEGAVLYPQYPVDRFFVDFGNPAARIAIECDGYAFHMDKAKDAARDKRLRDLGWEVVRFTGSECMKDTEDGQDEDGRPFVRLSPVRLALRRLISLHRIRLGDDRASPLNDGGQ